VISNFGRYAYKYYVVDETFANMGIIRLCYTKRRQKFRLFAKNHKAPKFQFLFINLTTGRGCNKILHKLVETQILNRKDIEKTDR